MEWRREMLGEMPFVLDTQSWPKKQCIFPEKDDTFQPFMPGTALVIKSLSIPSEANADKDLVFGIHTLCYRFQRWQGGFSSLESSHFIYMFERPNPWARFDSLLSKVFVLKAWGPEFSPQSPRKTRCTPVVSGQCRQRQEDFSDC